MSADRDAILSRRALFLASTLGGLSLGADAPPDAPPEAPPATPKPRAPTPMICLSDDPIVDPAPRRPTISREELKPIPGRTFESHVQVCLSIMVVPAYHARRDSPHLLVSLLAPTLGVVPLPPSARDDPDPPRAPLVLGAGGALQVGLALSRSWDIRGGFEASLGTASQGGLWQGGIRGDFLWNFHRSLWASLGGSIGYLSATSREGDRPWPLRSSRYERIDIAPVGMRIGADGAVELGLRVGLLFSQQRRDDGDRHALSMITTGIWLTYLFLPPPG